MRPNDYTSLQGWMYGMGLNLSELITYALIYGFSWDGHSCYRGTVEQIGEFSQIKRRQARDILARLERRGLITRKEVPGRITEYAVVLPVPQSVVVNPGTPQPPAVDCPLPGVAVPTTPAVDCPPNINNKNNLEFKDIPVVLPRTRERLTFGEYVQLTEEEHAKLVRRFGAEDTARLIEILDGYLSNPKQRNRYADHYRAILGWPVQRLQEEKLTTQRLHNSQEQAQRVKQPQAPVTHYADLAEIDARRKAIEDKYKN